MVTRSAAVPNAAPQTLPVNYHEPSLRPASDYHPGVGERPPDGGQPNSVGNSTLRGSADAVAAMGAATLGAAVFLISGVWRPVDPTAVGTPVSAGVSVLVTRTALITMLGASFLGLSVPPVQDAASRFSRAGWARTLSLPFILWVAIIAWAAATGRPVAAYALAYGAVLPLITALVVAWPSSTISPSKLGTSDTPAEADAETGSARSWPLSLLVGASLLLWLPVELSLLPPLPQIGAVAVSAGKFVAFVTALWLFLVVRPLGAVGHGIAVSAAAARIALLGFLGFAALAVPSGLAVGFLTWNPRDDLSLYLLRPVLIFFTIALPEEFVFRGVVQRALTHRWGFRPALVVTAAIFGLAHAPSLPYMALAALAGVAYGWVYQRTGRVAAAALNHALVDSAWVLFLRP